jgi:PIN domain nuclease of toxin-antitoxin system
MKYLLDTNVLIWFLAGDHQLSLNARSLISDPTNEIYTSIASLWEMAIKVRKGKLNLTLPFEDLFPKQLEDNNIQILDISVAHLHRLCHLPFRHHSTA